MTPPYQTSPEPAEQVPQQVVLDVVVVLDDEVAAARRRARRAARRRSSRRPSPTGLPSSLKRRAMTRADGEEAQREHEPEGLERDAQPMWISGCTAPEGTALEVVRAGSTTAPLTRTSKWRWAPKHRPVQPTRPITWPWLTCWPTLTLDLRLVGVAGGQRAAVLDAGVVAVAARPARRARRCRPPAARIGVPVRDADVDAGVAGLPGAALAERRGDRPVDRPDEVSVALYGAAVGAVVERALDARLLLLEGLQVLLRGLAVPAHDHAGFPPSRRERPPGGT